MSPQMVREGCRLHYERHGPVAAPVVLGIPPLGLDSRLWRSALDRVTGHGYGVIALDSRGCGGSDVPLRPWSIRTMAADAIAVLDHAGVDRVHVCGPSLGGMVAQELAISHPERVGALVLASTTAGLPRLDLLPWGSVARSLLAPLRRLRPPGSHDERVRAALRLLVSPQVAQRAGPGDPAWELVEDLMRDPPAWRGRVWQLLAGATHAAWERVRMISAPTHVQHGTADALIPLRAGVELSRRIPRASLHLVPGAGHALMLERPSQTLDAALAFLDRHAATLTR